MARAPVPLRSAAAALPLAGEVVRTDLLARLQGRWQVPVTTIEAGAGFGKSTLLAQALRFHETKPEGHEVYLRCEPGDEDESHLANAILHVLGPDLPSTRGTPVERVIEALRSWSPMPVCLVLDDVHELPEESSGAALISALVTEMPVDTHFVLAGRRLPELPIGRLEAADAVIHIDGGHLAFGPTELREVADAAGRPVDSLADLGGWPALVRLTLKARLGASRRYLWDEVVSGLPEGTSDALFVLALLRDADAGTVSELLGQAVDPHELAAAIPLVEVGSDGVIHCHQLWEGVVTRLGSPQQMELMRRKAVSLLLDRGAILRAGTIAARSGEAEILAGPAFELVRTTLGAFPADTGDRWLASIGPDSTHAQNPAVLLLDAARRQARNVHDPSVRPIIDEMLARSDLPPRPANLVLSLAAIAAHAAGDLAWLLGLVDRCRSLPDAEANPVTRVVVASLDAAAAELAGDVDAGIDRLEKVGPAELLGETTARFYLHLLLLAGRADEAVHLAEGVLADSPNPGVREYVAFVKWCAGDPTQLAATMPEPTPAAGTNDRFAFAYFVNVAPIFAALGADEELGLAATALARIDPGLGAKNEAQMVVAAAAHDVLRHDETSAARRFANHLAAHPITDMSSSLHLRRYPALGYMLSATARAAWLDADVGPSLRRGLDAAQLLIDARQGDLGASATLPTTAHLVTSLPLPWSVELLARAMRVGHPDALPRFGDLVDLVGRRVHVELDRLVAEGRLGAEENELIDLVPYPPQVTTRIELLGPMKLLVDGQQVEPPELRRTRVRELIGVLVAEGAATRERLKEVLWPELSPDAAARNLRVTLSYARRVLEAEPETPSGAHVRVEGDHVYLAQSVHLETDLWELQQAQAGLKRAERSGDPAAVQAALVKLVLNDVGSPFPDLARFEFAVPLGEQVRRWVCDAALLLGERRLTQGLTADATALAERARQASPYSERAGRLAIAAQLQRGDAHAVQREVDRLHAALHELGVEPDSHTQVLFTRVQRSRSNVGA